MNRNLFLTLSSIALMAACANGGGGIDDGGDDTTNNNDAGGSSSSSNPTSGPSGSGPSGSGPSGSGPSGSGGAGTGSGGAGTGSGGASAGSGGMGVGGGAATTTGSGMMNSCLHDTCTEGPALNFGCGDPCVDTVCNDDPYCCDQAGGLWDDLCVGGAETLCALMCNGGGGGGALPGDLVISEIMNNPAAVSDSAGEWFEIYNATGAPIELQGLTIQHSASGTETISSSVVVSAGGYVVLGINANTATNGNVNIDYQYSSMVNLNNTADYIAILDGSTVIDEVNYTEVSGLDPNGKSRNLDPNFLSAFDNDSDLHFCEAQSTMLGGVDKGTPGGANDPCP